MTAAALEHRDPTTELNALLWEAHPDTLQFTYVSQGAERLLGYALDEWLRRPAFWTEILHPDDREQAFALCKAAVDDGRDHEFEYRAVTADGRVVWIRDIVRVTQKAGRTTSLHGAMFDITRERQPDERGREASPKAPRAPVDVFAHDFRNLLQTIIINADMVLAGQTSSSVRRHLQEIRQAAEVGTALVKQLTQTSEPRSNQVEVIDVPQTLGRLGPALSRMVGEQIRLNMSLETPGPAHAHISQAQFERVVMNLVLNARDAMPAGGIIEVTVTTSMHGGADGTTRDHVTVGVLDTGLGMTPEVRSRIFEPHFTTKPIGSGLGLATVRAIVTDASGSVDVVTRPGKGSRFLIHLPRALPMA